mmetsp:Transcript_109780/g.218025  ORF Transcript_109780/g.218025 Transcript_109780/m.218025 type:complete len:579 (+) Transcript_109780:72-1808(+)
MHVPSWRGALAVGPAASTRHGVVLSTWEAPLLSHIGAPAPLQGEWCYKWAISSTVAATLAGIMQYGRRRTRQLRQLAICSAGSVTEHVQVASAPEPITKVDRTKTDKVRKGMYRSNDYYKFSRSDMANSLDKLKEVAGSSLLSKIRLDGFVYREGNITYVLAQSYGFCWGVERAIAIAHEARAFFPEKQIWCTNEIIHNPVVNDDLIKRGMRFIEQDKQTGRKDFSVVKSGDVVVLPAFGASVDEMAFLQEKKAKIVDTTCPWVARVWGAVETAKRKGHTSIVHGKYKHEETVATTSFAAKYLVVSNIRDAEYVCNYILEKGEKLEFLERFKGAYSEGFDPDADLESIGMANQTTMMKDETMMIGKLFERTMIRKYGPDKLKEHFLTSNTICDATQDRQNAMYKMFGSSASGKNSALYTTLEQEQAQMEIDLASAKVKADTSSAAMENKMKGPGGPVPNDYSERVDFVLIIGGYNSSNTTHLVEICEEEGVTAYHIDDASRIGGASGMENTIQHKPLVTPVSVAMAGEGLELSKSFVAPGALRIGVSSGASTPDNIVEECLKKILAIKQVVDGQVVPG